MSSSVWGPVLQKMEGFSVEPLMNLLTRSIRMSSSCIEAAQIALFGDHKPANVVVGIATISPGYPIEVDAIAVIDHTTESDARTR
jgi:enamine deaminase RidA (YjgF/YER057c/UK114 family)